jgi:ApbE superfamily uncharacterized protein (UPF0280 family)
MGPTRTTLPDGRLHWQHGPIELVIDTEGEAGLVDSAHAAAWARFQTILQELVDELPRLRMPVAAASQGLGGQGIDARRLCGTPIDPCPLRGPVARRMWQACAALPVDFITPMAAVAGAVAQEILAPYVAAGLRRASVNNGGDIALHVAPGEFFRIGTVHDIHAAIGRSSRATSNRAPSQASGHAGTARPDSTFTVRDTNPVRGVATSGWRGRSHSMGIADAVTVLAATAAQADAAATVLANAVNLEADHPAVTRAPARSLRHDSDLGERLVTVDVAPLPPMAVQQALARGLALARRLQADGLIHAAVLACQGQTRVLEPARTGTSLAAEPTLPLAA